MLFRQHQRFGERKPPSAEMLTRYGDVTFANFRPFVRWFRRAKHLAPVYRLYLSALSPQALYLEYQFLAFAQALESLHYRLGGKERTFREAIQAHVDVLPRDLRQHVPSMYADLVKVTRHYYSHWNVKYEKDAATGTRLYALTRATNLLFELAMLRALGFPNREISALVQSNQRLIRDFNWFFQV